MKKNRAKSIKICTFGGKSFPPHLFFPRPVLLFGRIFTYAFSSIPVLILPDKVVSLQSQVRPQVWEPQLPSQLTRKNVRRCQNLDRGPVHKQPKIKHWDEFVLNIFNQNNFLVPCLSKSSTVLVISFESCNNVVSRQVMFSNTYFP